MSAPARASLKFYSLIMFNETCILKISHVCMKQYVLNLYKFLKAKAGLATREQYVQKTMTKFECNIHRCALQCAVTKGKVT
jgi:hypothetical protein